MAPPCTYRPFWRSPFSAGLSSQHPPQCPVVLRCPSPRYRLCIAIHQAPDLPPGQLPLPRLLEGVRHPLWLGLQLLQPPPGWGAPVSPASTRPLHPQLEADIGLGIIIHIFTVIKWCPVFSHSVEYFILDKYLRAFQHVPLLHRNGIACIDLTNKNANKMDMIYFDVCQFSVNKEISCYYLIITPET